MRKYAKRNIFQSCIHKYNLLNYVFMNMPKKDAIKRSIKNQRRKNSLQVKNNLRELKIEGECTNII